MGSGGAARGCRRWSATRPCPGECWSVRIGCVGVDVELQVPVADRAAAAVGAALLRAGAGTRSVPSGGGPWCGGPAGLAAWAGLWGTGGARLVVQCNPCGSGAGDLEQGRSWLGVVGGVLVVDGESPRTMGWWVVVEETPAGVLAARGLRWSRSELDYWSSYWQPTSQAAPMCPAGVYFLGWPAGCRVVGCSGVQPGAMSRCPELSGAVLARVQGSGLWRMLIS